MTRSRYSRAIEIGLRLSHSKESLAYIKKVDRELYDEIMIANRRKDEK